MPTTAGSRRDRRMIRQEVDSDRRLERSMRRLQQKTNHLAHMNCRLGKLRTFDRDAVIALATDRHRSDQTRVRSMALTVAVDQGQPAAAFCAVPPPCREVAGWSVDDNWRGSGLRNRLGRGRTMLQELGDLIVPLEKPDADLPAPARRTDEGAIAQRAHVAAGDAEPGQFDGDAMAARAGNAERAVPPARRCVTIGSG